MAQTHVEGVKSGVYPQTWTFNDYKYNIGGVTPPSGYEPYEAFQKTFQDNLPDADKKKFASAAPTERTKMLREWSEEIKAFRQAHGEVGTSVLWLQQARDKAAQSSATTPAPALDVARGGAQPSPIIRAGTPEYVASRYQKRNITHNDAFAQLTTMGVSPDAALALMQPTPISRINDFLRGNPSAFFTAEDVRGAVKNKKMVPGAAVNLLMQGFGMSREGARQWLQSEPE